jgi:DNA repair protein RadC
MTEQELTLHNIRSLLEMGVSQLPDTALVGVLAKAAPPEQGMKTLDLSCQLLHYVGSLKFLRAKTLTSNGELPLFLEKVHHWIRYTREIFEGDEALLKASLELQRRALTRVLTNCNAILYYDITSHFLMTELSQRASDVMFSGLFLNQQHRMVVFEELFHGEYDNTNISHQRTLLKEIQQKAKQYKAPFVIMVKNGLYSEAISTWADMFLIRKLMRELHSTEVILLDSWLVYEDSSLSLTKIRLI